jgi:uncharacterized membrane protein YraQ (UPF0718 family)
MADVHDHAEDRSSFYLDQLFMIGVCGAIAAVTIMLWQSGLLQRMLHEKFHIWVALGGICLLTIVVLRAVAVWRSVDEEAAKPKSDKHDHGHDCGHSHGCDHDHDHSHEHPGAVEQVKPAPEPGGVMSLALAPAAAVGHTHSHSHSHAHGHSHSHGGHEHGWAPWRYVVLLLPVMLYFLVLSNPAFDMGGLVATPSAPLDYIRNWVIIFRSIVWEALPFIVLGALIAGMLEELLPQRVLVSLLPRNRYLAIAMGGLLGLIFPMCECGIIPIMRRLLRKGLPLSCCIAYVLAGPIVNVVVILSTVAAFSGMENVFEAGKPSYQMGSLWMTAFRVGLGYLTAVVTSLFVEWQHQKHGDSLLTPLTRPGGLPVVEEEAAEERRPLMQRVNNITETALHDFADITVFLIIGAMLAASIRMFLTPDTLADLSRQHVVLTILFMMGLAIALCLCSEADAFVAASFVTLRPAAKLSFLVLGPMIDFKLYFMYTRVFRPRLILTVYTAIIVQVFIYSLAVHAFWEKYADRLIDPKQSSAPTMTEKEIEETAVKVTRTVGLLAPSLGTSQMSLASAVGIMTIDPSEKISEITFLQLENASMTPEQRHFYQGRRVRLQGQFSPISNESFTLVRYKINCCAADATPLRARIFVVPEQSLPISQYRGKWVRVTGRVQFIQEYPNGPFHTALIVTPTEREGLDKLIEVVPPDPNPFVY